jgi:hypothetical protein
MSDCVAAGKNGRRCSNRANNDHTCGHDSSTGFLAAIATSSRDDQHKRLAPLALYVVRLNNAKNRL